MKPLSKQATQVFFKLVNELVNPGDYKKIDNTNGAFMPVSVDYVWKNKHGKVYAVSHYYTQNGDKMADPDMTFLVQEGNVFPMTYQQDGLGIYQRAIIADDEETLHFNPRLQRELVSFANTWMRNIKYQQDI